MLTQIPPHGLLDWFAQQPGTPLLLDVREPHEVAMSPRHVPGVAVLHMPMGSVPARLSELDPTRPLALLCAAGMRSQRVGLFLQAQGFERLANVVGGVSAWPT